MMAVCLRLALHRYPGDWEVRRVVETWAGVVGPGRAVVAEWAYMRRQP